MSERFPAPAGDVGDSYARRRSGATLSQIEQVQTLFKTPQLRQDGDTDSRRTRRLPPVHLRREDRTSSEEMYTFTERGDRSLTLRPEAPRGVMPGLHPGRRASAPASRSRLSFWPMFRYNQVQPSHFHERFPSFGVEAVATTTRRMITKVIRLQRRWFCAARLSPVQLLLNSVLSAATASTTPAYIALLELASPRRARRRVVRRVPRAADDEPAPSS